MTGIIVVAASFIAMLAVVAYVGNENRKAKGGKK